jgi:hypothetical protein
MARNLAIISGIRGWELRPLAAPSPQNQATLIFEMPTLFDSLLVAPFRPLDRSGQSADI